jgi:hypothetical protein
MMIIVYGDSSLNGAKAMSLTTPSIMTFSIMGIFVTLSLNDSQHKGLICDTQHK